MITGQPPLELPGMPKSDAVWVRVPPAALPGMPHTHSSLGGPLARGSCPKEEYRPPSDATRLPCSRFPKCSDREHSDTSIFRITGPGRCITAYVSVSCGNYRKLEERTQVWPDAALRFAGAAGLSKRVDRHQARHGCSPCGNETLHPREPTRKTICATGTRSA